MQHIKFPAFILLAMMAASQAHAAAVQSYPGRPGLAILALIAGTAALLIALAIYAAFVLRRAQDYRASRAWLPTEPIPGWCLPFNPVQTFYQVRDAIHLGDGAQLRHLLGPALIGTMLRDLPTEGDRSPPLIVGASFEVLDITTTVISIRYRAGYSAGGDIHEVWHFVPVGAAWRVNGIEQV